MRNYKEVYEELRKGVGRYRACKACDISHLGDAALAMTARSSCGPREGANETDYHNTLITYLHKGDPQPVEAAFGRCIQDPERVSVVSNAAELNGETVYATTMHCAFSGHNLENSIRRKMKAMVDALKDKGLMQQTSAEAFYRELSLLPKETGPTETRPGNARY